MPAFPAVHPNPCAIAEFAATAEELSDPEAFKASAIHKALCYGHAFFVLVLVAKGVAHMIGLGSPS